MPPRARNAPSAPTVLTPFDLMSAPEFAPLALLEHAIHLARLSLLAENPQLLYDDPPLPRATRDHRAELMIPRQSRGNSEREPLKAAVIGAAHERRSEPPKGGGLLQ
jgi:hypothetical protein